MTQLPLPTQLTQGEKYPQVPGFFSVSTVPFTNNCVTTAPGLEIATAAHLTVENANAFFFRQGSGDYRYVDGIAAQTVFPTLTGSALAFDNGSQDPSTASCRCYTFFVDILAPDSDSSSTEITMLYGADFPKHRLARTSDFNLGDGSKAIIGYLYVKNESSAVFTPGTTALNATGITARPSDQFGYLPLQ